MLCRTYGAQSVAVIDPGLPAWAISGAGPSGPRSNNDVRLSHSADELCFDSLAQTGLRPGCPTIRLSGGLALSPLNPTQRGGLYAVLTQAYRPGLFLVPAHPGLDRTTMFVFSLSADSSSCGVDSLCANWLRPDYPKIRLPVFPAPSPLIPRSRAGIFGSPVMMNKSRVCCAAPTARSLLP